MNETELLEEKIKESTIKKTYKIYGLTLRIMQNTRLVIAIISGLSVIGGILITLIIHNSNIFYNITIANLVNNIVSLFALIGFLTGILFIIIGFCLYVLYLLNKTDRTKKACSKKFISRGIIGLILIFVIWFIASVIAGLFAIDIMSNPPRFD